MDTIHNVTELIINHYRNGSYRGGGDDDDDDGDDDDDEMSVTLVEETGVPGGNHRPTASN